MHRLRRDAEFFKTRIGRLEAAGDTGDAVLRIVEDKKVVGETAPAAAPASEDKESKSSNSSEVERLAEAQGQTESNDKEDEKAGAKKEDKKAS